MEQPLNDRAVKKQTGHNKENFTIKSDF